MQGQERKKEILEAAVQVFARYGYEKASIAIICEAVGIARGTLYQYYKNKHDLFQTIVENYTSRIKAYMNPLKVEHLDADGLKKAHEDRLQFIFEEIQTNRDAIRILLREARCKNAETESLVREAQDGFINMIRQDIEIGVRAGVYRTSDSEMTAVWIFGGILGIVERYIMENSQVFSPKDLALRVSSINWSWLNS